MGTLRIGLTISGAISLGAYEGGALAALLTVVQASGDGVVIDAISGASAGSLTGLLAAHCLTTGADPVAVMVESWVGLPDLENLATHDMAAPLSADAIEHFGRMVLDSAGHVEGQRRQAEPVTLSFAMVSLGGLGYVVGPDRVPAVTHLDWATVELSATSPPEDWAAALSAALASGANAAGFPPRLFVHRDEELDQLRDKGLTEVSSRGGWYTDGGTIDNEPFGRLLDILPDHGDPADEERRLIVLVHPVPGDLPHEGLWTDPDRRPAWARAGLRANSLRSAQSTFEDLQRLVKTNTRLRWTRDLAADTAERIGTALRGSLDPSDAARVQEAVVEAFNEATGQVRRQHDRLRTSIGRAGPNPEVPPAEGLAEAIEVAVGEASGLAGKRTVEVEVVSPDLDERDIPAAEMLAGEKLGHFFGFTDVRFRQSDFDLGWKHMRTWLDGSLARFHVAGAGSLLGAVDEAYSQRGWQHVDQGAAGWKDLSWTDRVRAGFVAAHAAHVAERDVRHWDGAPYAPR